MQNQNAVQLYQTELFESWSIRETILFRWYQLKKAKKLIIVIYLDSISTKISISSIHILNKRWFYEISWTSHNRNWNSYLIGVLFIYYGNLYKLNFQLCLWITRVSQQICLRLIFIHELFLQNSIYLYLFNSILYAFNK